MINLAVLVSGRGSNLKAIIDSILIGYLPKVNLKLVISNVEGALALQHAEKYNIPYMVAKDESKILELLKEYKIDIMCLAGFNKILSPKLISEYKYKILNIHPSLLPSFGGGLHAQRDALNYGVKFSGCTVHFVEEGVDTGPIIIQAVVPVLDTDTDETLSNRILKKEHIIYSRAIKLISENRIAINGRKTIIKHE